MRVGQSGLSPGVADALAGDALPVPPRWSPKTVSIENVGGPKPQRRLSPLPLDCPSIGLIFPSLNQGKAARLMKALTPWRPTPAVSMLRHEIDDLLPTSSATTRVGSGSASKATSLQPSTSSSRMGPS